MANKKRLIDANYLRNKLIPNCPIEEGGIPLGDFNAHQKILKLYPTVDAVEVVHGYVLPAEEPKKVLLDMKCAICDQLMLSTDVYCPMCGAKMDGDGNG